MTSRRWLVLGVLVFARTGVGMQFIAVAALMPAIKAELALDYAQIGVLLGIYMISGVFLSLPSGMIAARLGDRGALWIGLASLMGSALLVGLSQSYPLALAGRLLGGMGAVFITVTASKIIIDWFSGREIATAMSFLGVTWPIGIGLGMSLLPWLSATRDWRVAILITATLPALAFLLTLTLRLEAPDQPSRGTTDAPAAGLWALRRRELWAILAGSLAWPLMNGGGYISFTSYAPLLLIGRGASPEAAGPTVGMVSWLFIVNIPLFGVVADRSGRGDLMYWLGCWIPAAAIALSPLGGPMVLWVVLVSLMGMTVGPIMALPGEVLSPPSRATGLGVYYTVYYLGVGGLPAVGGWIQEVTGSTAAVMWFSAACLAVSPLSLVAVRALQRRWKLQG